MKLSTLSKLSAPIVMAATLALSSGQIQAGEAIHSGEFVGASDHITTGNVSVERISSGFIVKLAKNFSLDGAPEPSVGFGNDGKYDGSSSVGDLVMIEGAQTFLVPADVDVTQFNEIYIWCDKFDVPLGVATLN